MFSLSSMLSAFDDMKLVSQTVVVSLIADVHLFKVINFSVIFCS